MRRRLAVLSKVVVSIGSVLGARAASSNGIQLLLNVTVPVNHTYKVHRIWKATPKGSGNGNQIHDLVVKLGSSELQATPSVGTTKFELTILRFSGKDLDGDETAHLKQIATTVQGEKIGRNFNSHGPIGTWAMTTWNNAGWAGMMALKSLGLYEIGFLDAVLPRTQVHLGSQWSSDVPFGDEGIYQDGKFRPDVHDVRGNIALCTYELKGIDPHGKTATVSFSGTSTSTMTYDSPFGKGKAKVKIIEKQSGKWVLSLKSGFPESFHAERRIILIYDKQTATEETTTDVVLAK